MTISNEYCNGPMIVCDNDRIMHIESIFDSKHEGKEKQFYNELNEILKKDSKIKEIINYNLIANGQQDLDFYPKCEKEIFFNYALILAHRNFPIRDDNDMPLWRPQQKIAIIKALKAIFIKNKKYIIFAAPVGAGKSAINYTIAATLGGGVYMTPFKQLQDQIIAEDWDGMHNIKGRNSYICNHVFYTIGNKNPDIRCDYKSKDVEICNTTDINNTTVIMSENDDKANKAIMALSENIYAKYKTQKHSQSELDSITAFNISSVSMVLNRKLEDITQSDIFHTIEKLISFANSVLNDKSGANYLDSYGEETGKIMLLTRFISCHLSLIECPAKSNKLLAMYSKIKVMNPDVFYYLDNSSFKGLPVMVYDEAQQIPDTFHRVFSVKFPVTVMHDIYKLDINDYKSNYDHDRVNAFYNHLKYLYAFRMIFKAAHTIDNINSYTKMMTLRDLLNVKADVGKNTKDFVKATRHLISQSDIPNEDYNKKFSIPMIISKMIFTNSTIKDSCESLSNIKNLDKLISPILFKIIDNIQYFPNYVFKESEYNKDYVKENGIDEFDFVKLTYTPVSKDVFSMSDDDTRSININDQILASIKALRDFNTFEVVSKFYQAHKSEHLGKYASAFVNYIDEEFEPKIDPININIEDKVSSIVTNVNNTNFALYRSNNNIVNDVYNTDEIKTKGRNFKNENYIAMEIKPYNLSKIMNKSYYSQFNTILLSSGTWVDPKDFFKEIGVLNEYESNRGEIEYIEVDNYFPIQNRPVYVLDRPECGFLNFSAKNRISKNYIYDSDYGRVMIGKVIGGLINDIRKFISDKHGEDDVNIIIHTNSYKITGILAEYLTCINYDNSHKFMFHLSKRYGDIANKPSNLSITRSTKKNILDTMNYTSAKGMVYVSPSLVEGVDFKNDKARAQIVLKAAIPYFGDGYVNAKTVGNYNLGIKKVPGYMDSIVLTKLIQAYGRVVRSKDDWGYTFIIDQKLKETIIKNSNPKIVKSRNIGYIMDAIQSNNGKLLWIPSQYMNKAISDDYTEYDDEF